MSMSHGFKFCGGGQHNNALSAGSLSTPSKSSYLWIPTLRLLFLNQVAEVCLMETLGLLADPPTHIPALMTMQKQQLRQPRSTRTRSSPPLPEQR